MLVAASDWSGEVGEEDIGAGYVSDVSRSPSSDERGVTSMGGQPEPLLPDGVVAPILTPFEADLSVSHDRLVAHAQRVVDEGCVGLAVFGTTGEALSVATREREAALEALVAGGIDPGVMIVGTGVTNLPGTVHLTRHAMELGCRACMVLPPFYFKDPDPEGLFRHFAGLVERIGDDRLRIMLYHIPQVAGVGLPVPLVARLRAEFPEVVVAIKDSSGDWANTEALFGIDGLTVYPGDVEPPCQACQGGNREAKCTPLFPRRFCGAFC